MDACDKSWKETLQVHLHAEVEICGTARCSSELYMSALSCSGTLNCGKQNPQLGSYLVLKLKFYLIKRARWWSCCPRVDKCGKTTTSTTL